MSNSDKTSAPVHLPKAGPREIFLLLFASNTRATRRQPADQSSMSSQTTGPAVKSSSWMAGFFFQNSRSFMNGCSGSGAASFPPSVINRRASESVDSSNNHKVTLCAFRRRPIVLSICPMNLSGAAQSRGRPDYRSTLRLARGRLAGSAQCLFGPLAFSYIDNCAHEFHKMTGLVANRMTDCVNVFNVAARMNNSIVRFEIHFSRTAFSNNSLTLSWSSERSR